MDSNFYSSLNMHDEHCVVWLAQLDESHPAKLKEALKMAQVDSMANAFDYWTKGDEPRVTAEAVGAIPTTAPVKPDPCRVFREMENLDPSELIITFVGDKADAGLGSNNLLTLTARRKTERIALAVIDLADLRTGAVNSQGAILLGMASKLTLQSTGKNKAKIMRLRKVFQGHLGIKSDPFEKFRKGAGWVPLFKVFDKRGAADERAKREGEFRTESLDQLNERGRQFFKPEEPDAAERWLREYDPDA